MPIKTIKSDLVPLLDELGRLRDATPVEHPEYEKLRRQCRKVSDLAERNVAQAIDKGDAGYVTFTESIRNAMDAIEDAMGNIDKVSAVIAKIAKVIDVAGKIVAKV